MTIDVSSILKELGGKIDVAGEVNVSDIEFNSEKYTFDTPLKIKGVVSNNGKALVLTADVEAEMGTQCARCLDDIIVDAGFSMEESFVQSDENSEKDEDIIYFDGCTIDIDDVVESMHQCFCCSLLKYNPFRQHYFFQCNLLLCFLGY